MFCRIYAVLITVAFVYETYRKRPRKLLYVPGPAIDHMERLVRESFAMGAKDVTVTVKNPRYTRHGT